MTIKNINRIFRVIIIAMATLGLFFLIRIAPQVSSYIQLSRYQLLVQLFFWITALPVFYILYRLWKMSSEFKKDQFFSAKIAKQLKHIAYAGIIESIIYAIASILGIILFPSNPPFFILTGLFFSLGIIIAIMASLLFHLFSLAEQLKDEHDLTI
ncbi:DUF2975 domain-containing protein [Vagococcus sp.]|uniref:DUF2975 domain-containing protein n=1 Tax=Vagococcus sp. TaxID=1933889 RepID=UPI003F9C6574